MAGRNPADPAFSFRVLWFGRRTGSGGSRVGEDDRRPCGPGAAGLLDDEDEPRREHQERDAAEDDAEEVCLAHASPSGPDGQSPVAPAAAAEHKPYSPTDPSVGVSRRDGTARESESEAGADGAGRNGPRLVLVLYALLVAVGGVAGVGVGLFVRDATAPRLLGLVSLPPTPAGFALYGTVTVGLALGVPLALVVYVSRRVDDPNAVDAEE